VSETRKQQTEEEERDALIFELGTLSGRTSRLYGELPSFIREMFDREGGLDIAALSTPTIADLCAAIRAEYPRVAEGEQTANDG
jgi:hypothetical protein